MAEGKKSFVAYSDWGDIFDELEDEEAGRLVKHLFDYIRDKNPVPVDKLTKMMFIQIQQALKRDLVKYGKYIDKQKENGKKGGRPKNPTLSEITQPFSEKPKKADSVSVSVNDNANDSEREKEAPHSQNLEDAIIHSIENSENKIVEDKKFISTQSNMFEVPESRIIELIPKFFNIIKHDPERNFRPLGKHKSHFISWIPYEIKRETVQSNTMGQLNGTPVKKTMKL